MHNKLYNKSVYRRHSSNVSGIHGSRYITTHGVALNCNPDLSWFKHIVPCGLEDKGVTSLSTELNKNVGTDDTVPFFLDAFRDWFDCELDESFLTQEEFSILPTEENLVKIEKMYNMSNRSVKTEV